MMDDLRGWVLRQEQDVTVARVEGRRCAREVGFSPAECVTIETAVSELAWNVIHYAPPGWMTFTPMAERRRRGLEIRCSDLGPGMVNAGEPVIREFGGELGGESGLPSWMGRSKGLGFGLSLVRRAMDEVEIVSRRGEGTRVVARKWSNSGVEPNDKGWMVPNRYDVSPSSLLVRREGEFQYAVSSRPAPGHRISGDAFMVKVSGPRALFCLVDGLGHGPEAAEAAQRAVTFIEGSGLWNPVRLLQGVHEALRGSRGAAIGLALADGAAGCLQYVGVGNVELRLHSDRVTRFLSVGGIVGVDVRRAREDRAAYQKGDLLLFHTDGVSSDFNLEEIPGIRLVAPDFISGWLMDRYGKPSDDATVLAVR